MKLLRFFAGLVLVLAVIVVVITIFLSPDDLNSCQKSPSAQLGCEKADAIVAVSGGDTSARTKKAIALYQAGWANTLVFSGAALDKSGPSNAKVMREEAMSYGVPSNKIIIEENGENTYENAEKTKQILDERGVKSVILVTSGYHQRRASMEFSRSLPGVDIRSSPVLNDKQWSLLWWISPVGWFLAISEIVKIMIVGFGGAL